MCSFPPGALVVEPGCVGSLGDRQGPRAAGLRVEGAPGSSSWRGGYLSPELKTGFVIFLPFLKCESCFGPRFFSFYPEILSTATSFHYSLSVDISQICVFSPATLYMCLLNMAGTCGTRTPEWPPRISSLTRLNQSSLFYLLTSPFLKKVRRRRKKD